MEANNSYCGVGIAYNARVGGIRLLDGIVTDAMEASALSFNSGFIDIYICSWGPQDDGAEMGGPLQLAQKALHLGTQKGRGGKGNIFVWASGNGGAKGDHCGADGYINSIYTIAIGGVTHEGKPAFFSEPCPATMAVTLTSGYPVLPLVTVSNLGDGCITEFAGTSSAAPTAAGIIALVLEANPDLTWRDIQHLISRTAKVPHPKEPGWILNGAGFHVHDRYGFGLLDAGLMVQQALQFQSVSPQRQCSYDMTLDPVRLLLSGGEVSVIIQSEACSGEANEINTLEHVQVTVSISSVCRGDLSIEMTSPSSTRSLLLGSRHEDASEAGLGNWTLMSVQFWGEAAQGVWTLKWRRTHLPLNHTCHPRHPQLVPRPAEHHPSSGRHQGQAGPEPWGEESSFSGDAAPPCWGDAAGAPCPRLWSTHTVGDCDAQQGDGNGQQGRGDAVMDNRAGVMDNRGAVRQCGRREESEEAAGVLMSAGLRLFGTYDPRRPLHQGPLRSFVSMGTSQPIPENIPDLQDRSLPQALIQLAFELESQRRVVDDDIPGPHKRKAFKAQSQAQAHPPSSSLTQHVEGTDGSAIRSYQEMMWKTLSTAIKPTQPSMQRLLRQKRRVHTSS
ncbi:neuroendocrine convertase 1-like [Clupea harengus]|uniref:Neuroendocrine convertase 1-like n=1 Tax=Clupea harengus TaxID=7950 RepID=A0A6P8GB72_CLUHA|nr:neuroendocrine convertase 1-like [Clupea harengus]